MSEFQDPIEARKDVLLVVLSFMQYLLGFHAAEAEYYEVCVVCFTEGGKLQELIIPGGNLILYEERSAVILVLIGWCP